MIKVRHKDFLVVCEAEEVETFCSDKYGHRPWLVTRPSGKIAYEFLDFIQEFEPVNQEAANAMCMPNYFKTDDLIMKEGK